LCVAASSGCELRLTFNSQYEYATEVQKHLSDLGFYVDVDQTPETLNKKIRNGELAQYNFLLGTFFAFLVVTLPLIAVQLWATKSARRAR
jgi:hypothetical protein